MKALLIFLFLLPTALFGQATLDSAKKLMDSKEFKKAQKEYTLLLKDNPSYEAFMGRADSYYEQNNLKAAIADYSKALEFNTDLLRTYIRRAGAFYKLKVYEKAILDYTKIIELKPKNLADFYFLRGLCKTVLPKEDKEGGCADIRKAKELGYSTKGLSGLNSYCNTTDLE